jgi:phosphoribosylaminoimidazole-succinocarboxamide synthase
MAGIGEINVPLKLYKRGKVRDVFEVAPDQLLIVSSDRISAFDYILPSLIPDKGKILNQISIFWFKLTEDFIANHIVCATPEDLDQFSAFADKIEKRSILTKKLESLPVEAIVRGYIVGSGWKTYEKSGDICGIQLPSGLKFADKFAEPLFTPTTKAEEGHDENMTFEQMKNLMGSETAEQVKELSLKLYQKVSQYAYDKGIIIADTKFEFGRDQDGNIILIDEIFTPDSSRFWKIDDYTTFKAMEKEPPAFDKQFVRNYLLESTWDRHSVPPELPAEVIQKTREKYMEIYSILTGFSI